MGGSIIYQSPYLIFRDDDDKFQSFMDSRNKLDQSAKLYLKVIMWFMSCLSGSMDPSMVISFDRYSLSFFQLTEMKICDMTPLSTQTHYLCIMHMEQRYRMLYKWQIVFKKWIPWNLSFHEKRLQTMLWHTNARVNSHQRWKQTRFRVCFHLWCELTSTMYVT